MWYHGLTHEEAAGVLNVSSRTVKRWWQAAREKLKLTAGDGPLGA